MFGLAPYIAEDEPTALPLGTRVRVNDPDFGGLGVVKIATVSRVPYSRVGVEFDGAPGFVWQFDRELVEEA